jgi:hypothetical protein
MEDRSIKPSTLSGGRAYARCMLHLSTLDANRIDEIEKGIAGLPGVLRTVVDYLQGAITVEYDPGLTSVEGIRARTRTDRNSSQSENVETGKEERSDSDLAFP